MLLPYKLTAIALSASFLLSPTVAAYAAEEPDGFIHTVINNEVTIIGYTGEPVFIEIPETIDGFPVTRIRDNAFFNCSSLKQISLPSSIKEIGHHTFYACSALESIVLPQSLEELGMGAFSGCSSLSAITIPETLSVLPEACFQTCVSLTEIVIPNGVNIIDDKCFIGCNSLSYVSIGGQVTDIGAQAFYMCPSLESLYIPPSVTLIEGEAVGFESTTTPPSPSESFTVLGISGSAAEVYADMNGLSFSVASEAINNSRLAQTPVKKVPLWVILILALGGIGFFALSCIIAVRQHRHERRLASEISEKIPVDKNRKV